MLPDINPETKVLTLRLPGDLTSANSVSAQAIAELVQSARDEDRPWRDVKFDLTQARMVDSAGLNLIVSALKAAQRGGGKLQLAYTDPNIQRTLRFTGLDKRLDLLRV
jgi:anti-anti-sigma factor